MESEKLAIMKALLAGCDVKNADEIKTQALNGLLEIVLKTGFLSHTQETFPKAN